MGEVIGLSAMKYIATNLPVYNISLTLCVLTRQKVAVVERRQ